MPVLPVIYWEPVSVIVASFLLVLINLLVAIASGIALCALVRRLRIHGGLVRRGWLAAGSAAVGSALWVSQFVGMALSGDVELLSPLVVADVVIGVFLLSAAVYGYCLLDVLPARSGGVVHHVKHAMAAVLLVCLVQFVFHGSLQAVAQLFVFGVSFRLAAAVRDDRNGGLLPAACLMGSVLFAMPVFSGSGGVAVVPASSAVVLFMLLCSALAILVVLLAVVRLDTRLGIQSRVLDQHLQLATEQAQRLEDQKADILTARDRGVESALASVAEGVITTNAQRQVVYMNPIAESLLQHDLSLVRGLPLASIYRPIVQDSPLGDFAIDGRAVRRLVLPDGKRIAVSELRSAIDASQTSGSAGESLGEAEAGEILFFGDISHSIQRFVELNRQARTDSLTGLTNRLEFERQLSDALTAVRSDPKSQRSLLYIDLDQFKTVNDVAGHAAGDELLCQLSRLMQQTVVEYNKRDCNESGMVARLGGDEFAVILQGCRMPLVLQIAEQLVSVIRSFRFGWHGQTFAIGASIGVVEMNAGIQTAADVLQQADQACFVAKENGRNRVEIFEESAADLQQVQHEGQWSDRLRAALDQDRFELFRQDVAPLYGVSDGSEFEVFLRMVDEQGQRVLPMAFLPAAGRCGLSTELDRWVVKATVAHVATLPASQARCVTINLTSQTLQDVTFADWLAEQLKESGVKGSQLCFDVSEATAVSYLSAMQEFVEQVRPLGCRFALDDFGSGMGTFSYLKQLPVDFIKIDGAFVKDIVSDRLDRAIVAAISEIGQVLGVEVVAEGVEDAATVARLRSIGVEYIQGSIVALPTPLSGEPDSVVESAPRTMAS